MWQKERKWLTGADSRPQKMQLVPRTSRPKDCLVVPWVFCQDQKLAPPEASARKGPMVFRLRQCCRSSFQARSEFSSEIAQTHCVLGFSFLIRSFPFLSLSARIRALMVSFLGVGDSDASALVASMSDLLNWVGFVALYLQAPATAMSVDRRPLAMWTWRALLQMSVRGVMPSPRAVLVMSSGVVVLEVCSHFFMNWFASAERFSAVVWEIHS